MSGGTSRFDVRQGELGNSFSQLSQFLAIFAILW